MNGQHMKRAIAKCRAWKAWYSKSLFYGNKNIYSACQDLLNLPPEVYGTGGQGDGSLTTAQQVDAACGLGGPGVYMVTRAATGGPEAVLAAGTFCVGCEGGTLFIRPLLHGILPSVFQ